MRILSIKISVVLIDNLRFDQWKTIQPIFAESFRIHEEETFYSILPTATQSFLQTVDDTIHYYFEMTSLKLCSTLVSCRVRVN